ncbi:type I restriction-modification system subunit M N-terminal domain-containing protein [Bacteroides fragilis]|uniref:type I restriction-modification system subunit M N-terminal domain-containing protein n=1 Tax=Bacteroides fragilis TaxID=817 RepID=UPI001D14033F|nr:type I restriction-modification system subunit M N-terminal domain-containing protein [Bacteroides fragilis]MCS2498542.1 type I restriction-modification system subunit M N-terminal domain-containing protein [Bacteroides fragilis]MCS2754090.1 type I restriction-modification system subunit M N-terminal domain-containing protein [Bacteroides fragilis]MCS2758446.1 type I restriction-modification system subunit M N-terminal domain-containing protein [Bacteroides fragilis]MCS2788595.1 type I restr
MWDVVEIIRNLYDNAEGEDVIFPFTLLRYLDSVLELHRDSIADLAHWLSFETT